MPYTLWVAIDASGMWDKPIVIQDNQKTQENVDGVLWPVREYGKFPSSKWPEKCKEKPSFYQLQ